MSVVNMPVVVVNLLPAISSVQLDTPRVLLMGTVPASFDSNVFPGSDTTALLQLSQTASYETYSDEQMAALIGTGSMFHRWKAAKKGSAGYVPIDMLMVKNAVAPSATTTITIGGAATLADTLKISVFDAFQFTVERTNAVGDTPTAIASDIADLLDAPEDKPYTVASALGVVTITWLDGFNAASTPVHVSTRDEGLAIVVANTGAAAPTAPLVDVMDIAGDTRYTSICVPDYWFSQIDYVTSFLDDRLNPFNEVKDGMAWVSLTDTYVNLPTLTASKNAPIVTYPRNKINGLFDSSIGSDTTRIPDADVAFLATGIDRMRIENAQVTDLVSGAFGLKDYTGGISLASLPYHNIEIPDVVPSNPRWYFSHVEQELLKGFNLSTAGVNRAGNTQISGALLTLMKTDTAGNPNTTWKFLSAYWTSSAIREYWDKAARIFFAKTRMTNGDSVPGRSMVSRIDVIVWMQNIYKTLGQLALVTAGSDAEEEFSKRLAITFRPEISQIDIQAVVEFIQALSRVNFNMRTTPSYVLA